MKILMYVEDRINNVNCFRILKINGGRDGASFWDEHKQKIYWIDGCSDFETVRKRMEKWNTK